MLRSRPLVLLFDRDAGARAAAEFLRTHELDTIVTGDARAATDVLASRPVDALVVDLDVPADSGLALLRDALARDPRACVIAAVPASDRERALEAWRAGASDVQEKPLDHERLLAVLRRGLAHQTLAARVAELESQLDERLARVRLAGGSPAIQQVTRQIRAIAATRATVLVEGEAGTGKGHVALAIHRHSPRRDRPFIAVDCAVLAPEQIEAELFGSERDAGAPARGAFEIADGGTLFLDAIGEAPASVQIKLLRVLQDRSFERAGTETVRVDVRLVVATQQALEARVEAGRFRGDLLQRLSAARVQVPPLRERSEDVPWLVDALVRELNRVHGRKATGVTRGVLELMARHPWPGNVRELESVLERMIVTLHERRALDVSDLPPSFRTPPAATRALAMTVGMTVDEAEQKLIEATLEHTAGDKPRAAAMLGIGLRTLYRKLQRYGIR